MGKALAADPRFLILDESTSRLGEGDVERLFRLLRRLRDDGTSTILITHRLPEIIELADRAVVLRDGRNVGELPRDRLTRRSCSASTMVGRELTELLPQAPDRPRRAGARGRVARRTRYGRARLVHRARRRGGRARRPRRRGQDGAARDDLRRAPRARRPRARRRPRGARRLAAGRARERHRARPGGAGTAGAEPAGSVRENIAMGTWPLRSAEPRRERQISRQAIDRLRIRTAGIEASIRSLSGGNQQKVVIARCLDAQPARPAPRRADARDRHRRQGGGLRADGASCSSAGWRS